MIIMNENYKKLKASYLFVDIARRISTFQSENPSATLIRLGIGDVTRALPKACIREFRAGVEEQGDDATFRGYGPEQGYDFLREKIALHDYRERGAEIEADEVFVSDGSKCDTGNFQELFSLDSLVGVPDPVYPVYVDTNVMAGRTGEWNDGRYEGLVYLEGSEENGFVPSPPDGKIDLIYLCFPNNPTGATIGREQLSGWVDYARENKALILFDAAYTAFIRDDRLPQSIFEIDGARDVAVEFRSFSKTAGFTGTRCAYTVIPKSCSVYDSSGKRHSLRDMWSRRHSTKFNGVSYPVQRAAAAVYSDEGRREVREINDFYLENGKIIRETFRTLGFTCFGGINSPYIWIQTGGPSWDFFDLLLHDANVVTTPGSGFGKCGEGYIRVSSFNSRENVHEAMNRIRRVLESA